MGMMPMATHTANKFDPASAAIIQAPKPMRPTAITVDAAFSITEKARPLLCPFYDGAGIAHSFAFSLSSTSPPAGPKQSLISLELPFPQWISLRSGLNTRST
jgi:hypothetical protein